MNITTNCTIDENFRNNLIEAIDGSLKFTQQDVSDPDSPMIRKAPVLQPDSPICVAKIAYHRTACVPHLVRAEIDVGGLWATEWNLEWVRLVSGVYLCQYKRIT